MIKKIIEENILIDNIFFNVNDDGVCYVLEFNVELDRMNELINFYINNYEYIVVMFKTQNETIINHYYDEKMFKSNSIKNIDFINSENIRVKKMYKVYFEDDNFVYIYNKKHLFNFIIKYLRFKNKDNMLNDVNYVLVTDDMYKIVSLKGNVKRVFKNRDKMLIYILENPNPFNLDYIYVDNKIMLEKITSDDFY